MPSEKFKTAQLSKLYSGHEPDRKAVEALIKRLNTQIERNPELSKKAALIIQEWMKQKPRR